jgi:thiol-disulfide isomerase/thioredoxin
MSMVRQLLFPVLGAIAAGSASAAETPAFPRDAVVLFVADWCAPCRGEVARLPEIAAAAAPRRVLVASADPPARAARLLRGVPAEQRWAPNPDTYRQVRRDLLDLYPGLPLSLVTDVAGRRCATGRLPLDAARTRALLAACAR